MAMKKKPKKKPRNYASEYSEYHSKPAQKKRRAGRNKARAIMVKAGKAAKGDGKDVHHKNGNPKDNKRSNIAVTSRKKNRGLLRVRAGK